MSQARKNFTPKPAEVLAWARRMVGVPFLHDGRNENGIDCWGLFLHFAQSFGVSAGDYCYQDGTCKEHAALFAENYHRHMCDIDRADAGPGDIILFRNSVYGVNHIAIFLGNDKFIHCTRGGGVAVQRLTGSALGRRIETFCRLRIDQQNRVTS